MFKVFNELIDNNDISCAPAAKIIKRMCQICKMELNDELCFAISESFLLNSVIEKSTQNYLTFSKCFGASIEERRSTQSDVILQAMQIQYNAGSVRGRYAPIVTYLAAKEIESGFETIIPAIVEKMDIISEKIKLWFCNREIEISYNQYLNMYMTEYYYVAVNFPISAFIGHKLPELKKNIIIGVIYGMFQKIIHNLDYFYESIYADWYFEENCKEWLECSEYIINTYLSKEMDCPTAAGLYEVVEYYQLLKSKCISQDIFALKIIEYSNFWVNALWRNCYG